MGGDEERGCMVREYKIGSWCDLREEHWAGWRVMLKAAGVWCLLWFSWSLCHCQNMVGRLVAAWMAKHG